MSGLLDALYALGGGVLDLIDMPGSYTRGLLAGRPGDRLSGRDMLEQWGVLDPNQEGLDAGDVAGFSADVLVDPLNLIGAGLFKGISRGTRLANEGIQAANKATLLGTADDFARQGQMVSRSNAVSQAMRAKGALPEELLPEAQKFYDYSPNINYEFALQSTPGFTPPRIVFDDGPALSEIGATMLSTDPSSLTKRHSDLQTLWPELFGKSPDGIRGVIEDLRDIRGEVQSEPLKSLAYKTDEMAHHIWRPSETNPVEHFDEVAEQFHNRLQKTDIENLRAIDDFAGETATSPQDLYLDILRDPNHPLSTDLRATEELRSLGNELIGDFRRAVHPAPEASQSFYAIPNEDFISSDLNKALTSDKFPATLLESLEKSLSGDFGPGSDYFKSNIAGVHRLLGGEMGSRLESQLAAGKKIPGPFSDVFEYGQTFLPYVAPKLQARPRWIPPALEPLKENPKIRSLLLEALLAYNAANMVN